MFAINSELCKDDGVCVEACPVSAITKTETGKYSVTEDCTDCGACEAVCDAKAVERID